MKKTYEELEAENEKLKNILQHVFADKSGVYFITGHSGKVDDNKLPEKILICPSYGVGWVQIYEKTNKNIMSEGS